MKTTPQIPRVPKRWAPVVWVVVAVVIGCVIGPALYVLVSPGTRTLWDWLGTSKEQLLTIGTVALAIATYALFRKTADMADATRQMAIAAQQDSIRSDRQHQQLLTSMLALHQPRLMAGRLDSFRPAERVPTSLLAESGPPFTQSFYIVCDIINTGQTAAFSTTATLTLHLADGETVIAGPFNLGTVTAGQPLSVGQNTIGSAQVSCRMRDMPVGISVRGLADSTLRITWQTLFGAEGSMNFVSDDVGRFTEYDRVLPPYVPVIEPL